MKKIAMLDVYRIKEKWLLPLTEQFLFLGSRVSVFNPHRGFMSQVFLSPVAGRAGCVCADPRGHQWAGLSSGGMDTRASTPPPVPPLPALIQWGFFHVFLH